MDLGVGNGAGSSDWIVAKTPYSSDEETPSC